MAMTAAMALRSLGQVIVFVIVARVLGVNEYGAYSAVLALAVMFGSLSAMGGSTLVLRDTAREGEAFHLAWEGFLGALAATTPFLLIAYSASVFLVLGEEADWLVIGSIGVAEICFSPILLSIIHAYQAHDDHRNSARVVGYPMVPRLVGALFLLFLGWKGISGSEALRIWTVFYLLATFSSAGFFLWKLHKDTGARLRANWERVGTTLQEGWAFAFNGAAGKVYMDIDKAMLARMTDLGSTGAYSAAYRVTDLILLPLNALLSVMGPDFFRVGQRGLKETFALVRRVLPLPSLYGAVAGVALWTIAPMVTMVLGPQYEGAVAVIRWLAWLPLVRLFRLFLQRAHAASNRQRRVAGVVGMGAVANVALNAWMIALWSWQGAVLATYAAELLMIGIFMTVRR